MRLFNPLELSIAKCCSFSKSSHKFASFVAYLSSAGITIGVAALIVVSSIMGGMQQKLKDAALSGVPQITVEAPLDKIPKLLTLPHVIAASPFIRSQVLLQAPSGIMLINLNGTDLEKLQLNKGVFEKDLNLGKIPEKGSFALNAQTNIFFKLNLLLGQSVRLISTQNARYTPMGLVPSQRLFSLLYYSPSVHSSQIPEALGNYDDVRRLLRYKKAPETLRLWLSDPFLVDETAKALYEQNFKYNDWRSSLGEFFKAVALEKLSMSIMLMLIVVVASFNILSALTMMVGSRLTDIAILKTLGLRSRQILKIFMYMGVSYGFIGSVLGTIIGIPAAFGVAKVMSLSQGSLLPVSIDFLNIFLIFSGSLFMSIICTLYPAIRAAKTDPVTHLARG